MEILELANAKTIGHRAYYYASEHTLSGGVAKLEAISMKNLGQIRASSDNTRQEEEQTTHEKKA